MGSDYLIRRIVGWTLIGISLWLFFPIPGPDDILNIIMGGFIDDCTGIGLVPAIILTYTLIPLILLYLGCLILPGNTHQKFHFFLGKVRDICLKIVQNPRLLMIAIIVFIILYYVYVLYISDMIIGFYTNV